MDQLGRFGHPRHQALCSLEWVMKLLSKKKKSFEGAEILGARFSYGRRPDSISPAALLGGGWQAAFKFR
jgi:hypothetical protein